MQTKLVQACLKFCKIRNKASKWPKTFKIGEILPNLVTLQSRYCVTRQDQQERLIGDKFESRRRPWPRPFHLNCSRFLKRPKMVKRSDRLVCIIETCHLHTTYLDLLMNVYVHIGRYIYVCIHMNIYR